MSRSPRSEFVLDEQLCFALYTASRAMTGAYRDGLARLGLTYTQYLVLLLLWEHGSLPMGHICERLRLDSATLSPLLKRLAGEGLIKRERSRVDERVVDITCTTQGHALRDRVHEVQCDVEDTTGLTADELATMRADLHRMADRLREHPAVHRS